MEQNFSQATCSADWIGVFDSGLGGLAIVRELIRELPDEKVFYFGDNLHMPYGERTLANIRDLSETIAGNLLSLPAKAVLLACNTASAAALAHLRRRFPGRHFVGMEPAVKPAVIGSRTRRVGVLATPATFSGEPFKRLWKHYAADARIFSQPCPGLADAIERYGAGDARVNELLREFIEPLLREQVDQLVLACTHYSLVAEDIAAIAGESVRVVDPSPAIARRVRQVLERGGLVAPKGAGGLSVGVSGECEAFSRAASGILGQTVLAEKTAYF